MAILKNGFTTKTAPSVQHGGSREVLRSREVDGRREMTRVIKMRPIVTLCGPTDGTEVLPPREEYVNTARMKSIAVYIEALGITNANVYLETAAGAEGPWAALATFAQHTVASILLTGEGGGGAGGLQALLRWRLFSTNSNWKACFWLEATPDQPQQTAVRAGTDEDEKDDF